MRIYGTQMARRLADTYSLMQRCALELERNADCPDDTDLARELRSESMRLYRKCADGFLPCGGCGRMSLVTSYWQGGWAAVCPTCSRGTYSHGRWTKAREEWNAMQGAAA